MYPKFPSAPVPLTRAPLVTRRFFDRCCCQIPFPPRHRCEKGERCIFPYSQPSSYRLFQRYQILRRKKSCRSLLVQKNSFSALRQQPACLFGECGCVDPRSPAYNTVDSPSSITKAPSGIGPLGTYTEIVGGTWRKRPGRVGT